MTALFIVGVVGVAILVVSVLLGDLLGIFDIGDGLISSASVGAAAELVQGVAAPFRPWPDIRHRDKQTLSAPARRASGHQPEGTT